jgi:catechol 2,3-dioxygenase-like lactoylglutathione lyase family enzyme
MPPIRRMLETAIYSDDPDRLAAFYGKLFDRTPMVSSPRLIAFDAGEGTVLLIFRRGMTVGAFPTEGGTVPGHDGHGSVHFAFAIDADTEAAWVERLGALGIPIESRVSWPAGGRSIYFRDPDGRSVELATPGLWPSY